jgi:hypothetical protein
MKRARGPARRPRANYECRKLRQGGAGVVAGRDSACAAQKSGAGGTPRISSDAGFGTELANHLNHGRTRRFGVPVWLYRSIPSITINLRRTDNA